MSEVSVPISQPAEGGPEGVQPAVASAASAPPQTPAPTPAPGGAAGAPSPSPSTPSTGTGTPLPPELAAAAGVEGITTVEDLAKSYRELRGRLSAGDPAPSPEAQPDSEPQPPQSLVPGDLMAAAQAEIVSQGRFTPETREKLEALGITKELLDFNEHAAQQLSALYRNQVIAEVGTPEEYGAMHAWAQNSLKEEDFNAFMEVLRGGQIEKSAPWVRHVKALWESATKDPAMLEGSPSRPGPQPFASQEEMMRAMQDERYMGVKADPAYQAEVVARAQAMTAARRQR